MTCVKVTHQKSSRKRQRFKIEGTTRPFKEGARLYVVSGSSYTPACQNEADLIGAWKDDNSVRAYLRRKGLTHSFVVKTVIPYFKNNELLALHGPALLMGSSLFPFFGVSSLSGPCRTLYVHPDAKWMVFHKTKAMHEFVFYFANESDAVHAKLLIG